MAKPTENLNDRTIRLPPYALARARTLAQRMTAQSCGVAEVTPGEVLRRACLLGIEQLEKDIEHG